MQGWSSLLTQVSQLPELLSSNYEKRLIKCKLLVCLCKWSWEFHMCQDWWSGNTVPGCGRRWWVWVWVTKGSPASPMPRITKTPRVTCCEMCGCQQLLCFAKGWNWKLLLFFFQEKKKTTGSCFLILNECLRHRVTAPIYRGVESSAFSAPSSLARVLGERFCTISKKGLENNFP